MLLTGRPGNPGMPGDPAIPREPYEAKRWQWTFTNYLNLQYYLDRRLTTSCLFPTPLPEWNDPPPLPQTPTLSKFTWVFNTGQGGDCERGGGIVPRSSPVSSLNVLLPQYRYCPFIIYASICTYSSWHFRKIVSWCNSEFRKQNAQPQNGLSKANSKRVFKAGVEVMYFQTIFRMLWAMVGN